MILAQDKNGDFTLFPLAGAKSQYSLYGLYVYLSHVELIWVIVIVTIVSFCPGSYIQSMLQEGQNVMKSSTHASHRRHKHPCGDSWAE